jgi:hypothetical protein
VAIITTVKDGVATRTNTDTGHSETYSVYNKGSTPKATTTSSSGSGGSSSDSGSSKPTAREAQAAFRAKYGYGASGTSELKEGYALAEAAQAPTGKPALTPEQVKTEEARIQKEIAEKGYYTPMEFNPETEQYYKQEPIKESPESVVRRAGYTPDQYGRVYVNGAYYSTERMAEALEKGYVPKGTYYRSEQERKEAELRYDIGQLLGEDIYLGEQYKYGMKGTNKDIPYYTAPGTEDLYLSPALEYAPARKEWILSTLRADLPEGYELEVEPSGKLNIFTRVPVEVLQETTPYTEGKTALEQVRSGEGYFGHLNEEMFGKKYEPSTSEMVKAEMDYKQSLISNLQTRAAQYEAEAAKYEPIFGEEVIKWGYSWGGVVGEAGLKFAELGHNVNKLISEAERFTGVNLPYIGTIGGYEQGYVDRVLAEKENVVSAQALYEARKLWGDLSASFGYPTNAPAYEGIELKQYTIEEAQALPIPERLQVLYNTHTPEQSGAMVELLSSPVGEVAQLVLGSAAFGGEKATAETAKAGTKATDTANILKNLDTVRLGATPVKTVVKEAFKTAVIGTVIEEGAIGLGNPEYVPGENMGETQARFVAYGVVGGLNAILYPTIASKIGLISQKAGAVVERQAGIAAAGGLTAPTRAALFTGEVVAKRFATAGISGAVSLGAFPVAKTMFNERLLNPIDAFEITNKQDIINYATTGLIFGVAFEGATMLMEALPYGIEAGIERYKIAKPSEGKLFTSYEKIYGEDIYPYYAPKTEFLMKPTEHFYAGIGIYKKGYPATPIIGVKDFVPVWGRPRLFNVGEIFIPEAAPLTPLYMGTVWPEYGRYLRTMGNMQLFQPELYSAVYKPTLENLYFEYKSAAGGDTKALDILNKPYGEFDFYNSLRRMETGEQIARMGYNLPEKTTVDYRLEEVFSHYDAFATDILPEATNIEALKAFVEVFKGKKYGTVVFGSTAKKVIGGKYMGGWAGDADLNTFTEAPEITVADFYAAEKPFFGKLISISTERPSLMELNVGEGKHFIDAHSKYYGGGEGTVLTEWLGFGLKEKPLFITAEDYMLTSFGEEFTRAGSSSTGLHPFGVSVLEAHRAKDVIRFLEQGQYYAELNPKFAATYAEFKATIPQGFIDAMAKEGSPLLPPVYRDYTMNAPGYAPAYGLSGLGIGSVAAINEGKKEYSLKLNLPGYSVVVPEKATQKITYGYKTSKLPASAYLYDYTKRDYGYKLQNYTPQYQKKYDYGYKYKPSPGYNYKYDYKPSPGYKYDYKPSPGYNYKYDYKYPYDYKYNYKYNYDYKYNYPYKYNYKYNYDYRYKPPGTPANWPAAKAGLGMGRRKKAGSARLEGISQPRNLYADLLSVAKSQALYGKATHPSLRKRPGLWARERGTVPTVEMLKGRGKKRF